MWVRNPGVTIVVAHIIIIKTHVNVLFYPTIHDPTCSIYPTFETHSKTPFSHAHTLMLMLT